MVSFRISGNPTIYGLLALSAMEVAASQKPGSPLAILQQPTKGFKAATVAVSPLQPAQPVRPLYLAFPPIPVTHQAPGFAEPSAQSSPTPNPAETLPVNPVNPASFGTTSFRDLQSHWSQPFVELLATRGIISGYGDGTFQPDRDIQAAHFSMMLRQAKLYRLKVLQRELGMVATSTAQVSPLSAEGNWRATTEPTAETEAAFLLRTHDIRTRAQAAVFIYRNLQEPLVVSQVPTQEPLEAQVTPISMPWHHSQPTFSDASGEEPEAPGLSETFQWSTIEPDWVAQG